MEFIENVGVGTNEPYLVFNEKANNFELALVLLIGFLCVVWLLKKRT